MLENKPYSCAKPFAHTNGPKAASVVLVGEAWGENEEKLGGTPFVGWSGYELSRMLAEAGLTPEPALEPRQYSNLMLQDWWARQGLLLTNVLAFRPAGNKLAAVCGKKAQVGPGYSLPPLGKDGYLLPQYLPELQRLKVELEAYDRTCIVALGATASWALIRNSKITAIRGATAQSTLCPGLKVLPTYHPAGILRNWMWRSIAMCDFSKLERRERHFAQIRRPNRRVIINPTLTELRDWVKRPTRQLGVDTETKRGQIEMVGLARSVDDAIVVPFMDQRKPSGSYWPSAEDEAEAWRALCFLLDNPAIGKVFQNGLYDVQYFIRRSPCRPTVTDDTMLLSHALFPELPKGLGFLGSLYSDEASWKLWRGQQSEEAVKRDE